MRALCLLAGLLVIASPLTSLAGPVHFYVHPDGDDNNSGTDDRPFATIAGARDSVRRVLHDRGLPEGAIVHIAPATYSLTEPLTFTPADSGTEAGPIVYRGDGETRPIISGAKPIADFRAVDGRWVADLPEVAKGEWAFSSLWVNGERRQPARTPNPTNPWGDEPTDADYFHAAGPVTETDADGKSAKSNRAFHFRPEDLGDWPSLDDAIFVVFHSWATSLVRPETIDRENNIVRFTGPARWHYGRWQPDQRYFIEHLREGLDQPGEWYLDKDAGRLHYIPMPGEAIDTVEVVAPVAGQLLLLQGDPDNGAFVEHLHFENLAFRHTEYAIAPEGHSDAQAAFKVDAAVQFEAARHCRIERCAVERTGNYAVWFRAGSQHNTLRQSELYDLGAGGVRIGEGASPATPAHAADHNVVDNCFIHDGGRTFRSAVGVWIGRASHNRIGHNEICDFRYTGVSVGWSWGYAESSANHNLIQNNHIHHIGRGQLNDMGGIYCLGVSPGTELTGNVIHDVISHPRLYGGWGLYTDEGSSEILLKNNLVYRTRTGTFHQHYGRDNRVVNNILCYAFGPQIIRSREEDHNSFFFERNIVYFNNGQTLGSTWKNGNWTMDHNCYWDTTGAEPDFAGRTWDEWRAEGHDPNSILADPTFMDPEQGDFRLKLQSPALMVGFVPWDLAKAGLYGDPAWVDKPKRIDRTPFEIPEPPKSEPVADNFEDTPVGAPARNANTLGETVDATIRVTDETAAEGRRALKFQDAPGLDRAYNPHLVYTPHHRSGTVTVQFALRPEPGANLYHEWRDNRSPYRAGPTIAIRDNTLFASHKPLQAIPPGQWTRFEVTCPLGKAANGKYTLTVTPPDAEPKTYTDLPCTHPKFQRLDWLGFVSNATDAATTYLDGLRLDQKGSLR